MGCGRHTDLLFEMLYLVFFPRWMVYVGMERRDVIGSYCIVSWELVCSSWGGKIVAGRVL